MTNEFIESFDIASKDYSVKYNIPLIDMINPTRLYDYLKNKGVDMPAKVVVTTEILENFFKEKEYNEFLLKTDWIESYHVKHLLGLELIPENSSKWSIINKRSEYKEFLKNIVIP